MGEQGHYYKSFLFMYKYTTLPCITLNIVPYVALLHYVISTMQAPVNVSSTW